MSKSLVSASASTVRAFWQANAEDAQRIATAANVSTNSVLGADGDTSRIRGRINPAFYASGEGQALLTKAGLTYGEKSSAEVKTVEVPRVSPKTGRAIKSTVLPLSEARVLAGEPENRKGKMSSASLLKVAEALTAAGR
jgi:hypothetical protein